MKLVNTYMSGAGNLFSVIDNRDYNLSFELYSRLAPVLCSGKIKTEGLLVINNSTENDFEVLFFNPDGSSDMMCGNGGRCAIFFASELNFVNNKNKVNFSMAKQTYSGIINNDSIQLILPPPVEFSNKREILIDNLLLKYIYVDVGSKHIVIDCELNNISFDTCNKYASDLRNHEFFKPEGVNVNFYYPKNDNIVIKTFEKGVEDFTGACGTGAIATSISAIKYNNLKSPVTLIPPSKSELKVYFKPDINNIEEIILEGKAEIIDKELIDVELN